MRFAEYAHVLAGKGVNVVIFYNVVFQDYRICACNAQLLCLQTCIASNICVSPLL
jgi:hypothetical protein